MRRSLAVAAVPLVLTTALLPVAATPGYAADEVPATDVVAFGLQPANAQGTVDERALYQYEVAPRTAVFDYVGVVNYAEQPLQVSLYPTDAGTDPETGAFSPALASAAPRDVGAWITIEGAAPAVTLPPATDAGPGTAVLPLTIEVPEDAAPGDHAGAVVASLATLGENPDGQNVELQQRVAVRVYLRIAGDLAPGLAISDLSSTYRPAALPWRSGAVDVRFRVMNSGNVRMGVQPSVRVGGLFGLTDRREATQPVAELLPGASSVQEVTVHGVWSATPIQVSARLEAIAAPGAQAPTLSPVIATTRGGGVPWAVPVMALGLILAAAAVVVWRRRLRRRRTVTTPRGPR